MLISPTMEKLEKDTKVNDPNPAKDDSPDLTAIKSNPLGTEAPCDVFNSDQGDVNFRGVSWQAAAILIAKFQIGLGALSIPSTFHVLGFFPGIVCFLVMAMISTVAGYICGNARQYYPHMHSIGDAAEILFGKGARELVGFIYYIYLAMTAGAGMLTTSVALNTLSEHATCTMVLVAATCVAGIIISLWITAIACLTQDRPAAGPSTGPVDLDIRLFPKTTFPQAMTAISNQLFAVGATGTFCSIAAEMKHPEKFTRALIYGQSFIVLTCIAIGSIVYGNIGQYLASPALGSAGPLIAKISYGIALPGLVVTAVLYSHIAAKYWFVRLLRGTRHLQSNTVKHWTVWVGSMIVTVVFAFIIVGVVPFFGDFLSLVGALVNPVFINILPGFMLLFFFARKPMKAIEGVQPLRPEESAMERHWLVDAFKAYRKGWKNVVALCVACFLLLSGMFIIIGGTYSTVLSIKQSYDEGEVGSVFSCADNS